MHLSYERLSDPRFIDLTDNYLIIGNNKGTPLIEVYNINSLLPENKFLSIGNGSNEVLTIGNIQLDVRGGNMYVSDLFKRKLLQYPIDEIAINKNISPSTAFDRGGDDSPLLYDKMYVGKDVFVAESRDPKGRIILIDKESHEARYFLSYPDKEEVDKTLSDFNNAGLYASTITVHPSLEKIALATYNAGMIDICEINESRVIPRWNYSEFYPSGIISIPMGDDIVVAHTNSARNGFTSICSSNKYIYALFSGKFMEDPTYPYGNEVYVVDWNGENTHKIVLDRSINRLAVDANDEYIYGITSEMDIMRFKIPEKI